MNIIFMGTPQFALPTLIRLFENHNILCVITQPDTKKNRGKKLIFSPIKQFAIENNIKVIQPEKIRHPDVILEISKYEVDFIVVVAYGQILPQSILKIPKYGCINAHASLLPKYRGAAPVHWALINGEKITGVTTMYMDKGMDTGDILLVKEVPISDLDDFESLYNKLSEISAQLMIETIDKIQSNEIVPKIQEHTLATYANIITKDMGHINFNKTTSEILNLIRGIKLWPTAYFVYYDMCIKVYSAEPYDYSEQSNITAGKICFIDKKKGFVVKTKDGFIVITEVKAPSSKKMSCAEYLRGNNIDLGYELN